MTKKPGDVKGEYDLKYAKYQGSVVVCFIKREEPA